MTALEWHAVTPVWSILEFWHKQKSYVRNLVQSMEQIIPVVGDQKPLSRINYRALTVIMKEWDMGGENWLTQIRDGFPIMGRIRNAGVYPDDTDLPDKFVTEEELQVTAPQRWAELERIIRQDENTQVIWDTFQEEVAKKWLSTPIPVTEIPDKDKSIPVRRFVVRQTEKIRPIDNYKRSGVNDATTIYSKLRLPSLDHFVEIARRMKQKTEEALAIVKVDHENAYKQLPVIPEHRKFSIIVARNPEDGRLFGAFPNQLMFGSVSAVQHYNVISRIIATLCVRVFRIPLVGYFDDYAGIVKNRIRESALEAVKFMNHIFGFQTKDPKDVMAQQAKFLGLIVNLSPPWEIIVPEDKRIEILRLVQDSLGLGRMDSDKVEKLIGKLNFFQMYAVGRIMRYTFPIMYKQLYSGSRNGKLSTQFLQVLRDWEILFSRPVKRVIRFTDKVRHVIYTDASSVQGGSIGGCLIAVSNGAQVKKFSTKVPSDLIQKNVDGSVHINLLETMAAVVAMIEFRKEIENSSVVLFNDNNTTLISLLKGCSKNLEANKLAWTFWKLAAIANCTIWMERVNSAANPADTLSRQVTTIGHSEVFQQIRDAKCEILL